MKIICKVYLLLNVTLRLLVNIYRYFGGADCLLLQGLSRPSLFLCYLDAGDGSSKLLANHDNYFPINTALYPRRLEFLSMQQ
jgi:hypothetical protein